jgi:hypothetical protein
MTWKGNHTRRANSTGSFVVMGGDRRTTVDRIVSTTQFKMQLQVELIEPQS